MNTNEPEHTECSNAPTLQRIAQPGERCSECHWTSVGLLNLGDFGTPRWVCHGCCKRAIEQRDGLLASQSAGLRTPAPTPPADAPEPPWVVAAWDCAPLAAVPPPEYVRIIRRACEAHAAALAQSLHAAARARDKALEKRDALAQENERFKHTTARLHEAITATGLTESEGSITGRVKSICDLAVALAQERDDLLELNRLLENTPSERLLAALTDVSRLTEELDHLTAERDALKAMLAPSFSSDPNAYPKAIATLTAERDRYHAALLGVANHVYITGQSCWCNAWEEHPEHYRPDQHHAYCTVALALSGAQGAPDAALAPTQKEEA